MRGEGSQTRTGKWLCQVKPGRRRGLARQAAQYDQPQGQRGHTLLPRGSSWFLIGGPEISGEVIRHGAGWWGSALQCSKGGGVADGITVGVGGATLDGVTVMESLTELRVEQGKVTLVGPSLGRGTSSVVAAGGRCGQGIAWGFTRAQLGVGGVGLGVSPPDD